MEPELCDLFDHAWPIDLAMVDIWLVLIPKLRRKAAPTVRGLAPRIGVMSVTARAHAHISEVVAELVEVRRDLHELNA